jgi:hypothetical protein
MAFLAKSNQEVLFLGKGKTLPEPCDSKGRQNSETSPFDLRKYIKYMVDIEYNQNINSKTLHMLDIHQAQF